MDTAAPLPERNVREARAAALVVNIQSRQAARLYPRALRLLAQHGISITAAYPVRDPQRLASAVQDAIGRGHDLIIVGGGDGTISSVVDYFAYGETVFGLLPLGTGNSFAETLGIPFNLEGAVRVIAEGQIARVDLGKMNEDYFANMATLGLSSDAARRVPRRVKYYFGALAYALAGAQAFLSHRPFDCHLASAEFTGTVATHQVVVGNGRYYGRTPLAPDATVQDFQLTVYVVGGRARLDLVAAGAAFLLGKRSPLHDTVVFSTQAVSIEADPAQYVDLDGEVTARTPVRISVAPRALKVLVPRNPHGPSALSISPTP